MIRTFFLLIFAVIAITFTSCSSDDSDVNYGTLPTFSEHNYVNVVIEIPAGTNKKLEYDYDTNTFPADIKEGKERVVDFLGYPGNYGFIPSTFMDPEKGGDGDALDVLVLCSHLPTGTVIEVIPIGMIDLKDGGEQDTKIIAVPVDKSLRTIQADNYKAFDKNYSAAQRLVKLWFLNYKGKGAMKFDGWDDEEAAMASINKWAKAQ